MPDGVESSAETRALCRSIAFWSRGAGPLAGAAAGSRRVGLAQALDLAIQPGGLAARFAGAPAVVTAGPPAHAQPGQDAQQQHADHQQIERHDDEMRQRPQRKLHRLAIADRDQHADQDEEDEQGADEKLHATASMAQRGWETRES